MKTLMRNGRDRRSENPRSATRAKSACFWLGPISGSHQGQQPQWLHLKAGYMAAPVSFREKVRFFSLAPRAPSIHGTSRLLAVAHLRTEAEGTADLAAKEPASVIWSPDIHPSPAFSLSPARLPRGVAR